MIRFMWQHTYLEFMVSFSVIWLIRNYYGISEIQEIFVHCIEIRRIQNKTTTDLMKNMIAVFHLPFGSFFY